MIASFYIWIRYPYFNNIIIALLCSYIVDVRFQGVLKYGTCLMVDYYYKGILSNKA